MSAPALNIVHHHPDATGPRVVLVHGSPDRSANFAKVLARVPDLRVTTYDRRGYGRSVGFDGGGIPTHALDLIDVLAGEPAVVMGHSAGGAVAMLASTKAPDLFLSIGTWEPPMVAHDWWAGPIPWKIMRKYAGYEDPRQLGEEFNRSTIGDARWEALDAEVREQMVAEGAAFQADAASQMDVLFEPTDVTVPLVIGAGSVTWEPHIGAWHRLAERAGAEYLEFEGASHHAHVGFPDAFVTVLRRAVELAQA